MPDSSPLFDELQDLATEQQNPHSTHIDTASVEEILRVINTEDHKVPIAVRRELPHVVEAVEVVVEAFKNDGRLFYVGAGTSGRLGVVDASECPPTFGTDPEMVQGIIAGGKEAVFRSQEGAEDVPERGAQALKSQGVTENDVVCGIASSGRTPFVVGAVEHARDTIGCPTLFVTTIPRKDLDVNPDVAICPVVGPEVVMGSTRMKSGTAQKLVLNMITTAAMVRLGKVYENMMVDLRRTSEKLVERGIRTVMMVTGVDYDEADAVLDRCDGHVKTAIVMILAGVGVDEARRRLEATDGFVRPAIEGDE
ncbi:MULTISPECIES: N-acetylmuramic acid 6-phosphate etherase [Salinibacter]|uniref:N-acetylmuramic acid 6-phosphate etherase n=1 Tax=Salinibacter TaxID=146918 RepID=UPI001ABAF2C4|nr:MULTISPECIES: N-acetylmuramic acid 6-phosphate etherase [Salinibacter]